MNITPSSSFDTQLDNQYNAIQQLENESHQEQTPNNRITADERQLLDNLVQSDKRDYRVLNYLDTHSISTSNEKEQPKEQNNTAQAGFPKGALQKGGKSFSSSDLKPRNIAPGRIHRNQSADTIMLKSALASQSANKPRKVKSVSFLDVLERESQTSEEDELEAENESGIPKQLIVDLSKSASVSQEEMQKLQKELEELRKKLSEFQTSSTPKPTKDKLSNSDVIVDVPQLADSIPVTEIITMVSSKLNLSIEEIKQDFEIMNKARIKDVGHLRMLMNNEQLWKDFELPILEKCAIEQILGKDNLSEGSNGWLWVGVAAFVPVALTGLLFNNPTTNKVFRFFEEIFDL